MIRAVAAALACLPLGAVEIVNEPTTITVASGANFSHTVRVSVPADTAVGTPTLSDAPGGVAKPAWLSSGTVTVSGTQHLIPLTGTNATGSGPVRVRLTYAVAGTTVIQDLTLIVTGATNG